MSSHVSLTLFSLNFIFTCSAPSSFNPLAPSPSSPPSSALFRTPWNFKVVFLSSRSPENHAAKDCGRFSPLGLPTTAISPSLIHTLLHTNTHKSSQSSEKQHEVRKPGYKRLRKRIEDGVTSWIRLCLMFQSPPASVSQQERRSNQRHAVWDSVEVDSDYTGTATS